MEVLNAVLGTCEMRASTCGSSVLMSDFEKVGTLISLKQQTDFYKIEKLNDARSKNI